MAAMTARRRRSAHFSGAQEMMDDSIKCANNTKSKKGNICASELRLSLEEGEEEKMLQTHTCTLLSQPHTQTHTYINTH